MSNRNVSLHDITINRDTVAGLVVNIHTGEAQASHLGLARSLRFTALCAPETTNPKRRLANLESLTGFNKKP